MKTKGLILGVGLVIFALATSVLGQAAVRSAGGSQRGGGVGVAPTRNDDRSAGRLRVGDRLVVTKNLPRERLEAHYGPSDRNITRTNGVFVEIPEGTVVEVFSTPRRGGVLEVVPVTILTMSRMPSRRDLREHFVPARFITHDFRYYTIQLSMDYLGVELMPEEAGRGGVAVAPTGRVERAKTDDAATAPAPVTATSAADQARQRFFGSWYLAENSQYAIFDFHENGAFQWELFGIGVAGTYDGTWDVVDGRALIRMKKFGGEDGYDTLTCYFRGDTLIAQETSSGGGPSLTKLSSAAHRAAVAASAAAAVRAAAEASEQPQTAPSTQPSAQPATPDALRQDRDAMFERLDGQLGVHKNSFIDPRDGQTYRTVRIGNRTWMAQNLNYQTANSWCYGNADSNCVKYGRLYIWNAAMTACPAGWRLPTNDDWEDLTKTVIDEDAECGRLKSKSDWHSNGNGTDDFGFSALPGGTRSSDGRFGDDLGRRGYWWSATEGDGCAYRRAMFSYTGVMGEGCGDKNDGLSVRCVTD